MDRQAQLRELIEYARQYVSHYSDLLPHPSTPLPKDLLGLVEQMPLLSRGDVKRHRSRLISSEGETLLWKRVRSTGTTGEPVEVIIDHEAKAEEHRLFAQHVDQILHTSSWKDKPVFHLTLHAGSRSYTTVSPWHPDGHVTKWNLTHAWRNSDDVFLSILSLMDGSIITAMPSVMELLCQRILSSVRRRPIRPDLIVLSGEEVTPELKSQVKSIFRCKVTSLYTMAESGIIGMEAIDREGYQVATDAVFLEIVDENGRRKENGAEGEIAITPLKNRAMPLIRYRTGDRGWWIYKNSKAAILRLSEGRRPVALQSISGTSVNIVRFVKLFAGLNWDRYWIDQKIDGAVVVSYRAEETLDQWSVDLVRSILRGTLGPDIQVQIRRITNRKPGRGEVASSVEPSQPYEPGIDHLARWLRRKISIYASIDYALITGSSLDPSRTTRFSDIDLMVFVRGDPDDRKWIDFGRELKSYIPRLSPHFERIDGLAERAPLLVSRIFSEQIPIKGKIEDILSRPSRNTLKAHGLFWTQQAISILRLRLTNLSNAQPDPVYEAYVSLKFIMDALRYRYLLMLKRETSIRSLLEYLHRDPEIQDDRKNSVNTICQSACEHLPPPFKRTETVENHFKTSLFFVRSLQDGLVSDICRHTKSGISVFHNLRFFKRWVGVGEN